MRRDVFNQVAKTVPFDNSTGKGFSGTNVQSILEELRDHTIYISETTSLSVSGTLTLTSANKGLQYLTGSGAGYTIKMPDATTLTIGAYYQLINTTSNTISIVNNASGNLFTLSQNSIGFLYLELNGSAAGTWIYFQILASSTASGIINYNVTSSTGFSTTSATDVVITGMTVTPQAGTYGVWYNSTNTDTQNNASCNATVYMAGSSVTDSKRTFQTGSANMTFQLGTQTVIQVNGSQAVDVRISTNQGTMQANGRSLLLIRLGP